MPVLLDAGLPGPARGVFTTRQGGVSNPPWDSLNLGVHVDDAHGKVLENRRLLTEQLGVDGLAFGKQVHGNGVRVVRGLSNKTSRGLDETDGMVTTVPGLAVVVLGADCLPVLFASTSGAAVVGAAHVGRKGLVVGTVLEVVRVMREQGAEQISATLGPAICGRCYEVPGSMAGEAEKAAPGSRSVTGRGTTGIDLRAGVRHQLATQDIAVVEVGGCTLEQPDLFYSYRRDGLTGRHAGVAWLA